MWFVIFFDIFMLIFNPNHQQVPPLIQEFSSNRKN